MGMGIYRGKVPTQTVAKTLEDKKRKRNRKVESIINDSRFVPPFLILSFSRGKLFFIQVLEGKCLKLMHQDNHLLSRLATRLYSPWAPWT